MTAYYFVVPPNTVLKRLQSSPAPESEIRSVKFETVLFYKHNARNSQKIRAMNNTHEFAIEQIKQLSIDTSTMLDWKPLSFYN